MTGHQVIVSVATGDWNLSPAELKALAATADATYVVGHGVDSALVRGAEVVDVEVLAEGGSDHPPVVYTLDVDGTRIVVLAWNVYVGQRPARVRRRLKKLIKQHRPDVITLAEAYRCRDQLARLAGYHLVQGDNVGEGADCALLVRVDHHLKRSGTARMTRSWIGPKHNVSKAPRQYPHGRIPVAPVVLLRSLAVHLPTGGFDGRNREAVDESADHITRWFKKGQR